MVQEMVKDAHWVKRINDVIVPKIKSAQNIHDACRKYFEILEEMQQEVSHKDDQQCRCRSILLQSKHAWIVHAEPEYRENVERAVFTHQPAQGQTQCWIEDKVEYAEPEYRDHVERAGFTQGQTQCWLRDKVEYYRSAATAFDTPHIRQRHKDMLSLMKRGQYRNAAALYWYIISSVGVKVTEKYPALHHNDNTCDCERYFMQAPTTKTVSMLFGIEYAISAALDIKKKHKSDTQEKCWTMRTLAKYKKYVRVNSLRPRIYTYTPCEIISYPLTPKRNAGL
jgi:hypothetical protein